MPKYRGGNGPPVQGSALGKEGRKYGVGMGKNCPFMRETTALKPTMDGVGMGENCPFMHGKRLLSPTNYWAEVPGSGGKNAPNIELYRDGSQLPSHLTPASNLEL